MFDDWLEEDSSHIEMACAFWMKAADAPFDDDRQMVLTVDGVPLVPERMELQMAAAESEGKERAKEEDPSLRGQMPKAPVHTKPDDTSSSTNIQITIGDQTFGATLHDSAAVRDLVAQLPVTVEMTDHGGVEKTGRLPGTLSLEHLQQNLAAADIELSDAEYASLL